MTPKIRSRFGAAVVIVTWETGMVDPGAHVEKRGGAVTSAGHDYWLYAYNEEGGLIAPPLEIFAADDEAAIARAGKCLGGLDADLRDGARLVTRISRFGQEMIDLKLELERVGRDADARRRLIHRLTMRTLSYQAESELPRAEAALAASREHLERQRERVAEDERVGRSRSDSRRLLHIMTQTYELQVRHVNTLKRELRERV